MAVHHSPQINKPQFSEEEDNSENLNSQSNTGLELFMEPNTESKLNCATEV